MVHAVRTLAVLFIFAGETCFADLDLTPAATTKELDGAKIPILAFQANGHTATYQPPHNWSFAGSPASLHLFCSGEKTADATVEKIPLPKPVAFDEPQMKIAADAVLQSLPKGTENAKLVSQEKNPVKIGGKETIETTATYTFFGHSMEMSSLDLNMGNMLLRFKMISEKKDFETMHNQFRGSLFSWTGL